jgi:cobalt-zinc-cadmium efflux system outer membrane protein
MLFLFAGFVTGCSKIPPVDDGFVACTVSNRTDSQVQWRQGDCPDEQVQAFIEGAAVNEINVETAIQIALLNNPKIQAVFEEVGISQADLIEAGLLSNPSFEIEVRYPHIKGLKTNIEYLITSSLLDLFLIPLRVNLASTEFEQTKLRVSHEILDLAFEVRKTYYELVASLKKIGYIGSVLDLTSIISEVSSRQIEIGNINTLEFQLAQARLLDAELALAQTQTERIRLREKMNRLLGFHQDLCLILPEDLPLIDYYGFDLCDLECVALQERLDLQVARFELARISQMLGLKGWWTYMHLKAGLAGERDPDGTNLLGPGFSGEIPIFNYGQATRLRLFAQLRQAKDRLGELEIRVLSEVREAHQLLMNYLKIINDYQARLLPMQDEIVSTSEALYNVMGLGLNQLLDSKIQEIVAAKNYTENLKHYLIARVDLDRALGGYLFKLLPQIECVEGMPP